MHIFINVKKKIPPPPMGSSEFLTMIRQKSCNMLTTQVTKFGSKLGHHFMRNRLMLKANGHRLWQHWWTQSHENTIWTFGPGEI